MLDHPLPHIHQSVAEEDVIPLLFMEFASIFPIVSNVSHMMWMIWRS